MDTVRKVLLKVLLPILSCIMLLGCTSGVVHFSGADLVASDLLHNDGFYAFVPLGLSNDKFEELFGFSYSEMSSNANKYFCQGTELDKKYVFF